MTTAVQLEAGDGPDDDKLVTVRRLGLVQGIVKSVLTTGLEQDLPGAQIAVRQGVAGTPFVGTTGSTGTYRVTGTTVTDGLVVGGWQVEATAPGHDAVPATAGHGPRPDHRAAREPRRRRARRSGCRRRTAGSRSARTTAPRWCRA